MRTFVSNTHLASEVKLALFSPKLSTVLNDFHSFSQFKSPVFKDQVPFDLEEKHRLMYY